MSADNWTNCPQCKSNAEKKKRGILKEIRNKYGGIPFDEWSIFKSETETEITGLEKLIEHQNLAEYCQVGIKGDVFEIDYRAHCAMCGFDFEYKHQRTTGVK